MANREILAIQARTTKKAIESEKDSLNELASRAKTKIVYMNPFDTKQTKLWSSPRRLLEKYRGIIFLGSGDVDLTVRDEITKTFERRVFPLMENSLQEEKQTLGICLAHQAITLIAGGEIGRLKERQETGTTLLELTKAGRENHLFDGLPESFDVVYGHKDSITKIPNEAVIVGRTEKDPYSALQIGSAITFQGHPELVDISELQNRIDTPHDGLDTYEVNYELKAPHERTKEIIVNFLNTL